MIKKFSTKDNSINKVADIHIKTPTPICGKGFGSSHNFMEEDLRDKLEEFGFYEVITSAGNRIYTAQFTDTKLAINIYKEFLRFLMF